MRLFCIFEKIDFTRFGYSRYGSIPHFTQPEPLRCLPGRSYLHSNRKVRLSFGWKEYINSLLRECLVSLRHSANFHDMQLLRGNEFTQL